MQCSVLILTYNEEENISRCINSLSWSDDIVVLDSLSSDSTQRLASSFSNVRVFERPFDGYASQRNYGLKSIEYKHEWLLMVDADEVVEEQLAQEIRSIQSQNYSIYRMRRKDFFYGKWLKRSSGYPTWFGRLLRIEDVQIEREINEEYVTNGKVGHLNNHLLHYPFSKGIEWWFSRHNRYSSMEAELVVSDRGTEFDIRKLFSSDPVSRRKHQKALLYSLPLRPLIVFFYLYIIKLGVLDGINGFKFSAMRMCYEFMIDLKVKELQRITKAKQ